MLASGSMTRTEVGYKCLKPSPPTELHCSTCRMKLGGEEHVNEWNKIQTTY
jgi:ferredoxin